MKFHQMKDSGIEWIGKIPEDWELNKIGALYEERNIKVSDQDYPPLSVTKQGVVPQLETAAKTDNGDNRKLIKKNDFVINSRSDRRGSCGISEYDGSCSLINTVLKPRQNMHNRYYNYVFRSELFADEFYRWGNGIVDDLWSTKWDNMKRIYVPFPNIDIQKRIADFLDDKCSKIDRYIEKQQQVIEKLNSYKMSLITENAISNYMTIPLRHLIKSIEQGWSPPAADKVDESIGWSVLSLSAVKQGKFHGDAKKPIDISSDIPHILELHNNDFLMTRSNTRELVGDVCIVEDCSPHMIFSDLIYRITFKDGVSIEYMRYALLSSYVRQQIQEMARGSSGTMPKISHKSIKELRVPLLEKEEQGIIVQRLNKVCSRIDKIICQKETIIKKLTEYKKSLIYEAVTGKLEV